MEKTNILIAGDLCPIGRAQRLFELGGTHEILGSYQELFEDSDFVIANLECPLIDISSPIEKDGRVFGVPTKVAKGIKSIGIDALGLANNHINDHGSQGVISTLETCDLFGIKTYGAGRNRNDASKPLIQEIKGERYCFLGVAETEFSIATRQRAGANSIDVINIIRSLREIRDLYDHLIVTVHGGREYYKYPTPKLQELCRFLVEEGAEAVICQHSHCIGSLEYYQGIPIIYGQGNFIFDSLKAKDESWNYGLFVQLSFSKDSETIINFVPFYQSSDGNWLKVPSNSTKHRILCDFISSSDHTENQEFVLKMWQDYCHSNRYLYFSRVLGHSKILRVINRHLHFSDWLYSKRTKLMVRNVVECEVHREGLETLWTMNNKKLYIE